MDRRTPARGRTRHRRPPPRVARHSSSHRPARRPVHQEGGRGRGGGGGLQRAAAVPPISSSPPPCAFLFHSTHSRMHTSNCSKLEPAGEVRTRVGTHGTHACASPCWPACHGHRCGGWSVRRCLGRFSWLADGAASPAVCSRRASGVCCPSVCACRPHHPFVLSPPTPRHRPSGPTTHPPCPCVTGAAAVGVGLQTARPLPAPTHHHTTQVKQPAGEVSARWPTSTVSQLRTRRWSLAALRIRLLLPPHRLLLLPAPPSSPPPSSSRTRTTGARRQTTPDDSGAGTLNRTRRPR